MMFMPSNMAATTSHENALLSFSLLLLIGNIHRLTKGKFSSLWYCTPLENTIFIVGEKLTDLSMSRSMKYHEMLSANGKTWAKARFKRSFQIHIIHSTIMYTSAPISGEKYSLINISMRERKSQWREKNWWWTYMDHSFQHHCLREVYCKRKGEKQDQCAHNICTQSLHITHNL